MATSIITTTTFTVATMFEYRLAAEVNAVPEQNVSEEKIANCTFAALPRCAWTARVHCERISPCRQ